MAMGAFATVKVAVRLLLFVHVDRKQTTSQKSELLYSSVCELCSRQFAVIPIIFILFYYSSLFTVIAVITVNSVMTCLSVMILAPINFGLVALII